MAVRRPAEPQRPLSWNEIRARALAFSREWADESSEDAEAKSFWDGFFQVFGLSRRRVAAFERPVRKQDGRDGYIDLLWKGVLLVEHKSRGRDLDRALAQALDYFPGLPERDLPRWILVSDFARLRLHDLDTEEVCEFALKDLHKEVRRFGFIAGYQTRSFGQQDPVNVRAAERLGRLHDLLKDSGYEGHALEVLLVRLLFCLFADDTSIFERRAFQDLLEQKSAPDGSDLGPLLAHLFQVLDTEPARRQRSLDEQLAAFPWVNGRLFAEALPLASFSAAMREALLDCCGLDWSRISPAVFGSLFQSIMDKQARRNLGAHYTTEENILKVLRPLFLDQLERDFEAARRDGKALAAFHGRLAGLTFLDPACGCGNFLVIAYRELRELELRVLRELYKKRSRLGMEVFNIAQILQLDVDQFYGIELEEFPAQIAQVALWLIDHQMNLKASEEFGQHLARLPLAKHATIVQGNALQVDWRRVIPPASLCYILGNPPFVGAKFLSEEQRADVARVFGGSKGSGLLDYVACWYRKAVEIQAENPAIRAAFVSTNSITQGEQPAALWPPLLERDLVLHFAHRTFQWSSEARGKAAVHCVIIGFGLRDTDEKWLFDYETPKGEPQARRVSHINPYLVEGPDVVLANRSQPLCDVPVMRFGNQPIDGGHLLLDDEEQRQVLQNEPKLADLIRLYIGSEEFINGQTRWCLWLRDSEPERLRSSPFIRQRLEGVREFRKTSKRPATRALADTPSQFAFVSHPDADYLLIPSVSSENRPSIPIGFMHANVIASNLCLIVPQATHYHLGVLISAAHMTWTRAVCGRLESRYRYSAGIVYNNFPWPTPTPAQRRAIEAAARDVLAARQRFPDATLADLYDPLSMPPALLKAHQTLDHAVDAAYGVKGFASEAARVAFLFQRYLELAARG